MGERSVENIKSLITQYNNAFLSSVIQINYNVEYNSNSYANSMLYFIGIEIQEYITGATPLYASEFPGSNANPLLIDGDSPDFVIIGTDDGDIMRTGYGKDVLTGGIGNDTLDGGGGLDVLNGGAGACVDRWCWR